MGIMFDRLPEVLAARGCKRSKHYNDIKAGLFVPPVELGKRARGYPRHEKEAINAAVLAGKSEDEIRALVQQLIAKRKAAA
jgi:prophage regulatory protein